MSDTNYQAKLNSERWRLNNLYYIKDKQGKKIKFKMNWAQELLYLGMWYLNIILKARQLGMTTFIQIFMLDRCLFNANTNAGVIAHNKDDAESFFEDKIKFAYENLPEDIRCMRPAKTDSTRELAFSNGSRIRVGTSMRSGTLQYLHVSEFGKMCAKYPDKAKEVISGSLNAVAAGQFVWIESTAEGPHGRFYDLCQKAVKLAEAVSVGRLSLTPMDYKFWFFPWFEHPDYVLHGVDIPLDDELLEYFKQLEQEEGITLSKAQRMWYAKKKEEQGDDMKQEYPATPQEAFEKLLKGVIFADQLRRARKEHRICELPIERGIPVNTFWDLGRNDTNAIWFHQRVGAWDHFIHYYEYRLVDLSWYVERLADFRQEFNWVYGTHYLPFDVDNTDLSAMHNESRKRILERGGVKPITVVPRIPVKNDAIELGRKYFSRCKFDVNRCAQGIKRLEGYRWVWDETYETFRKTPLHDDNSNGADAYMQYAQGYQGERGTVKEQIEQINGTGGRKYLRGAKVHNPITNPTYDHVV